MAIIANRVTVYPSKSTVYRLVGLYIVEAMYKKKFYQPPVTR